MAVVCKDYFSCRSSFEIKHSAQRVKSIVVIDDICSKCKFAKSGL